MKYSCEELLLMEPVEIYKLRLNGTIKRFPKGLFVDSVFVNVEVGIKLTKYLLEDILHWSDEEICQKIAKEVFHKYKLKGMLQSIFNSSPYQALEATYPGRFKPWQLNSVSHNYWNEQTAREATIWLLEEKLKWSDEDICMKLNTKTFIDHGLSGMMQIVFNYSPYKALELIYPGRFKPWQLSYVPHGFWNKETAREATRWLIEEKLKWTDEDIIEKFSYYTFLDNGLIGMLENVFCTSPYQALENAYPRRFKAWQLSCVVHNYWNKETGIEATKWLIEKKLKWSDEDICNNLCAKTFEKNGLGSMLTNVFNTSPYQALNAVYPDKFKPWQLKYVPNGYWNEETAREAIKWLVEEKFKWTDEDICRQLSIETFKKNGLAGMLVQIFNGSPHSAIEHTYPNRFTKVGNKLKKVI